MAQLLNESWGTFPQDVVSEFECSHKVTLRAQRAATEAARQRSSSQGSSVTLENAIRLISATNIGDQVAADSAPKTPRKLLLTGPWG
jgi:hypothetical protein